MNPVHAPLTKLRQALATKPWSLDFAKPAAEDLASPEAWRKELFSSKAARDGKVIRRSERDIRRYAGWSTFVAEIERRGYQAVENSGQVVIFCNRAPIRPVARG